jgi:DNA repair protein RecO (recombination protein O)
VPLYRDEAVVLRTYKLGEADRIATLLSKHHGQFRAVVKGVRRTSSKFGAKLEPFMVVDAQFAEGRSLDVVSQAETLHSFGLDIMEDYSAYTAAHAIVEAAERLTSDESNQQQYLLLVGALRSLSRQEHAAGLILDSYLLRALSISGWAPNFVACANCGEPGQHGAFVIQLGGVVCDNCRMAGAAVLDGEAIDLLAALLTGDWKLADAASDRAKQAASGIVAAYSQFHIERGLKSLSHVERE